MFVRRLGESIYAEGESAAPKIAIGTIERSEGSWMLVFSTTIRRRTVGCQSKSSRERLCAGLGSVSFCGLGGEAQTKTTDFVRSSSGSGGNATPHSFGQKRQQSRQQHHRWVRGSSRWVLDREVGGGPSACPSSNFGDKCPGSQVLFPIFRVDNSKLNPLTPCHQQNRHMMCSLRLASVRIVSNCGHRRSEEGYI